MRAIKATSLQRKVTKPLKSWEKRQEDKSRGCGEGGRCGSQKPCNWGATRETNCDSGPPRSASTCTQTQSVVSVWAIILRPFGAKTTLAPTEQWAKQNHPNFAIRCSRAFLCDARTRVRMSAPRST